MNKELVKKSRYCSKLLRHNPEDLKMDKNGWVDTIGLLKKLNIDSKTLDYIVEHNDKKRFIYNQDKSKIRANQGHTLKVDVGLKEVIPPETLFHGTSPDAIKSIFQHGLKPMKRNHVHLSADIETAKNVGKRHCKKIGNFTETVMIIVIDTKKLLDVGFKFYLSENGVWLTSEIPSHLLKSENENS